MRVNAIAGLLIAACIVVSSAHGGISRPGTDKVSDATAAAYSGAPVTVPATIQAENFDLGGEGVGYHDNVAGNAGGYYRLDEDVDIIATTDSLGGGYDVAYFETGEWLDYTIDVPSGGDYTVELRAATNFDFPNSAFHIEVDGEPVTGSVVLPDTGGWSSYRWLGRTTIPLSKGTRVLRVVSDRPYFALNAIRVRRAPASTPYSGAPIAVPATIQAEDFDLGGEGVAYHDNVAGNSGGQYRSGEAVDIVASADPSGGAYDVVHFQQGEWLKYTISVPSSGDYAIELRAATNSDFPDSAFHVEVDGQNVTGSVVLPDTGGWSNYQWVGRTTVSLSEGTRVLKVVSDRPHFALNAIRVGGAPVSTPYSGTPIAVPGTLQAENFDLGGEGVAYHDNVAGNAGGQHRPAEDVDIVASGDSAGGLYDVVHFQAGEWLNYIISVANSGNYTIELRAATNSDFPNSAFHVEIDGQDVTGSIVLPDTGGWSSYQWIGQTTIPLSQGTHLLKLVSDRPYFALNAVRIRAPGPAPGSAELLFRSGFEGTTAILPPLDCWGTGCWQEIVGIDSITNFSWPPNIWGGGGKFLLLTDPVWTTAATIGDYLFNRIETVTGHDGNQTRALYQRISQNVNGTGPMGTSAEQNDLQILPQGETSDLYVSYWLRLQPDLVERMNNLPPAPGVSGGGTWRGIFAFKTGGQTAWGGPADNGDYRVEAYVMTYGGGQPYWAILGDNNAGGGAPLVNNWYIENRSIPVPVDRWFKLELFWHRSNGSDGRVWMAVDGQVIADRRGPNMGAWNLPINRIIAPLLYSGSAMPIYQWVDDLEIWDGFPGGGNPP